MSNTRAFVLLLLLQVVLAPTLAASADDPPEPVKARDDDRKPGFFRQLGRSLRDTALDVIDQKVSVELHGLLDAGAGRIEGVKLAGRRADYVIVDLRYVGVLRPEGMFITATAAVAGAPVSLLVPTPVPLVATAGTARMALRVEDGADLTQVDSLDVRLVRAADRSMLYRAVFPLDLASLADTLAASGDDDGNVDEKWDDETDNDDDGC